MSNVTSAPKTTLSTAGLVARLDQLSEIVDDAAKLKAVMAVKAEELKGLVEMIKSTLKAMKTDDHITPKGNRAQIVDQAFSQWDMDILEKILDQKDFEKLCPRKAEGEKLRMRLESGEETLKKAVSFGHRKNLVITSAAK
jgi:hypothetical protein